MLGVGAILMSGHNTSFASTLPSWIMQPGEGGTLRITCPSCGGKAVVNKSRWLNDRKEFIGRSCTYCFKTSKIREKGTP